LLQVLVTFGPVLAQSRPGLHSALAQGCPLGVLPLGTQARADAPTEHCSPAGQPHWGTVSLHGSSEQAGPELVDVVVLPLLVGPLPVLAPPLPVLAPPLPVEVGPLPVLVLLLLPVVGLVVVVSPPGPLVSPPVPPVTAAFAQAERRTSKLLKTRRDRGRMQHLANEKKRVPEPTPVTSKVNVLQDPS
jgi:hypothetical protein